MKPSKKKIILNLWNSLPSPVDCVYSMYMKHKWISGLDMSLDPKLPHYTCENNFKNLKNPIFEIFLVPSLLGKGCSVCDNHHSPLLELHTWSPVCSLTRRTATICFVGSWTRLDQVPSCPVVIMPGCLAQGIGWYSFLDANLYSSTPSLVSREHPGPPFLILFMIKDVWSGMIGTKSVSRAGPFWILEHWCI